MFDKFFVGLDLTSVEDNGLQRPISRVTFLLDDENSVTAGDDTGLELLADCPHATQEMANTILAQVKGYKYQMFSADDAALDPAAELGDGVTAGGIYSVISRMNEDGSGFPSITAPGEAELEDEYPAGGPMTQTFDRKIAETRSRIAKTAEEIRLEVANDLRGLSSSITVKLESITQLVEDTENGLRSEFTVALSGISSRVSDAEGNISSLEQTARSLTTRISNAEGDVSSLEQFADSLSLSVSNGSTSSTIRLMVGSTQISSREIEFTGVVSFSDLWGNETIINGSTIDTSTLFLDSLYGDEIYIRDNAGQIAASFEATGASSTAKSALAIWSGAIRMQTYTGDIYLRAVDGNIQLDGDYEVTVGADLFPKAANRYSCGTYNFPWSDVYSTDGTISSSDKAGKFDIDYDMSRYSPLFDALRPCSFRRTGGDSFRAHTGLIAQDVAEARNAAGLPGTEFAAFCSWDMEGGAWGCGLRYEEFIALLIYEVQALKKQVKELKGETA